MNTQSLVEQCIPVTIQMLEREYPNGILHMLESDADVAPPRQLHPIFFGCFDWHSSVHSYWQVLRTLRIYPDAPFVQDAMALFNRNFTVEKGAGEMAYLEKRPNFEMPYGMAWLLQLSSELREMEQQGVNKAEAIVWHNVLKPLEAHAATRFRVYLRKLPYPVRTGSHNQTAFSMALALDWARIAGDNELEELIEDRARHFFGHDVNVPLAYEPSGTDFLSPALAEADLMHRVLNQEAFAHWFRRFLGDTTVEELSMLLTPVQIVDFTDGQLAHFAGLNMSRAWMLEGVANALGEANALYRSLLDLATQHRESGLSAALHEEYMVSHWAPTFALYLLTRRGIA